MDLTDEEVTGTNIINITDSLNAPLLELNIKNNINTIIPVTNDLIIYIDKEATITEDRKQYVFNLSNKLNYFDSISDEFIVKPYFEGNKVTMKVFVKRLIGESSGIPYLLLEEEIEELEYQTITLFEGINYIYTNYEDATIELVYPKNNDLNNRFLSNAIYNEQQLSEITSDDLYFKDAFTESEDGINISANNVDINCITSKQNNFSLDSEGNLSVNSITSVEEIVSEISYSDIFNLIYPVGSIYLSVNATNPSALFEGTWVEWGIGRVPVGMDSSQTEFNSIEKTGGEKTHTLTSNEMPSHVHWFNRDVSWGGDHQHNTQGFWRAAPGTSGNRVVSYTYISSDSPSSSYGETPIRWGGGHNHNVQGDTDSRGGNQAHGNLQPYITCHMWKRVS